MKRRGAIAKVFGIAAGCVWLSLLEPRIAGPAIAASFEEATKTGGPHAEAVALVLTLKQSAIANAEKRYFESKGTDRWRGTSGDYAWHDVLERSWTVRRPFAPGIIDSTHMFSVSYLICGEVVLRFSVDTNDGTVSVSEASSSAAPPN